MATLTLVSIEQNPDDAPFENRSKVIVQSDPYKGGGPNKRVVEWRCSTAQIEHSESGAAEVDRKTGGAVFYFRNGNDPQGNPYCEQITAYVAEWSDRTSPISPEIVFAV